MTYKLKIELIQLKGNLIGSVHPLLPVITEYGLCHSSTRLHRLQSIRKPGAENMRCEFCQTILSYIDEQIDTKRKRFVFLYICSQHTTYLIISIAY